MAKNYFNRYVWLIDTIQRHGYITFSDISDLWRKSTLNEDGGYLPERTFFNHREAIEDMFGIEIKFDKSLGYFIPEGATDTECVRNWLLTSLSVNNLINECSDMHDRILFEKIPSGERFLRTVIEAMRESMVLEMQYKKFQNDVPQKHNVAPYCVKVYKRRWYMVAKEMPSAEEKAGGAKASLRIFSLDRISQLQQTRKSFKLPAGFNAAKYFADWFGIVHDDDYKPQKIRLKVWAQQRDFFRTLPLHPSQSETEKNAEWSIFEYFMAPTWDLEFELLQYNDNVEVLEPVSLRDMMIEHAWNMLHLYNEL